MSSKRESKENESVMSVLFSTMTSVVKVFVWAAVALVSCIFAACIVLPAVGESLISTTGIGAETPLATVMSLWLVPQLFIMAILAFAVRSFLSWLWRKEGEIEKKLVKCQAEAETCRKAKAPAKRSQAKRESRTRKPRGRKSRDKKRDMGDNESVDDRAHEGGRR